MGLPHVGSSYRWPPHHLFIVLVIATLAVVSGNASHDVRSSVLDTNGRSRRLSDDDAPDPTVAQVVAPTGGDSVVRWTDAEGEPCGAFELRRTPASDDGATPAMLRLRSGCGEVVLDVAADAGDAVTVHAPLRVASEAYETGYVDVGAELAALRAMLGGWGLDANATRIRMCHDNPGHVGAAVLDPDGDGPNAPFTAWCQHGWTLIAHIKNDVDGSGLPEWRDDWFTHMHGDPSAYPNTDQTTDNFDFRLFEAAVSEKTVLRFTNSINQVNRYMFGFTQESWADFYGAIALPEVSAQASVVGPCEPRPLMRTSRSSDLQDAVKCRCNGWWDDNYHGILFGTAPGQTVADNEGLGVLYGRNTHDGGSLVRNGNAAASANWYWWLGESDNAVFPTFAACWDDPSYSGTAFVDPDGDGGDPGFHTFCDHGYMLIVSMWNPLTGAGLPNWASNWFTIPQGDVSAYPRPSPGPEANLVDFRRLEPYISERTVLRFTNSVNDANRYMFGFTQENWADWYNAVALPEVSPSAQVVGPCEPRDSLRTSANEDLSSSAKCRQNGWWDASSNGMLFGTAPQATVTDSEGLGVRYGYHKHNSGSLNHLGNQHVPGDWYWWLGESEAAAQ